MITNKHLFCILNKNRAEISKKHMKIRDYIKEKEKMDLGIFAEGVLSFCLKNKTKTMKRSLFLITLLVGSLLIGVTAFSSTSKLISVGSSEDITHFISVPTADTSVNPLKILTH